MIYLDAADEVAAPPHVQMAVDLLDNRRRGRSPCQGCRHIKRVSVFQYVSVTLKRSGTGLSLPGHPDRTLPLGGRAGEGA